MAPAIAAVASGAAVGISARANDVPQPQSCSRRNQTSSARVALRKVNFLGGAAFSSSLAVEAVGLRMRDTFVRRNGCKSVPTLVVCSAASGESPAGDASTSLARLPVITYVNAQGFIRPTVPPGTAASVFAVLDKAQKVQYIGFSVDVRNTLRKLIVRRPYNCFFYKLYNLSEFDQSRMLAIRSQWYDELGGTPAGNADPSQRKLWESPADGGAVSERGKAAAAASRVRQLIESMVDRGVKEDLEFDPDLLAKGLCDVLPSQEMSQEEMAAILVEQQAAAARQRHVAVVTPAGPIEYDIFYNGQFPTNGGMMHDITVTVDDKESTHRVITSRVWTDALGVTNDDLVENCMGFLLSKRVVRQTEGTLTSGTFPINYFSVSEVEQWYPDFVDMFDASRKSGELPNHWKFSREYTSPDQEGSLPLLGPAH